MKIGSFIGTSLVAKLPLEIKAMSDVSELVRRIDELAEKATPGPWSAGRAGHAYPDQRQAIRPRQVC
jgi:hypothetical protein